MDSDLALPDVFISYAHEDEGFVTRLRASLIARDLDVWVDTAGIEPSDRWKLSAHEAIERSDACVFVMSRESLGSDPCLEELDYSVSLNKRLIPICIEQGIVDIGKPDVLADLSWVMMRPEDAYEEGVNRVVRALETDLDAAHTHTRILVRAKAWELANRRSSPLLRGEELATAEEWLSHASLNGGPSPTDLQRAFIRASRRTATKRQRTVVSLSLSVAVVAVALAIFAFVERGHAIANQKLAESRQLAASSEQVLDSDPELSTILAMDGLRIRYSAQAEAALRDAVPNVQALRTFTDGGRLYSVSLSHDGRRLVAAGHSGTIHEWDAASGYEIRVMTEPQHGVITNVVFGRDGARILTVH
jgi:TIR domain-containing protein